MDSLDNRFAGLENASRIGYLIGGFITRTLTIEERDELDNWVLASETNMQLFEDLTDDKMVNQFLNWLSTRDTEARLAETKARIRFKRKTKSSSIWWNYAAAAGIVLFIGVMVYKLSIKKFEKPVTVVISARDILPGSSIAQLRLPDGQLIGINEETDTVLNGIVVKNGEVTYDTTVAEEGFYEISIPRKGSYKLQLSDGTKVFLNSESSIRYPASFSKSRREISVTGETYFEVAKDHSKPFVVSLEHFKIQALGTQFNIDGFNKKVTLVEGAIELTVKDKIQRLKPEQQMDLNDWKVQEVDIDPIISWTRNRFWFKNLLIDDIMKQIQRWYDVKVIFDSKINDHLNASIDRDVPLSTVLRKLEGTGLVHFDFDGETITVKK